MKKTFTLIVILSLSVITVLQAQSYKFGIGFRGGLFNGITGKYIIKESTAIEGIIASRYKGWAVCGLYEVHNKTGIDNLTWFYGIGGHIASYKSYYYYGYYKYPGYYHKGVYYTSYYSEPVTALGIDGIAGIEYQFKGIPFTMGLDIKPYFDLIGGGEDYWDVAASVRYTIK